ncbi:hypothetical protein H5410_040463 [Solanum commersonii]|uniref:Uncharacterized protein n=1 Tax=Solanum commersonii TaxID=4109 RepID=A0A9J5XQ63_SOLCO|nr:hypothetical protein H5410_040463 [Solanum commersonii]
MNNLMSKEKDKEIVSSKEIFVVTRRRKLGCLYKAAPNENTTSEISVFVLNFSLRAIGYALLG